MVIITMMMMMMMNMLLLIKTTSIVVTVVIAIIMIMFVLYCNYCFQLASTALLMCTSCWTLQAASGSTISRSTCWDLCVMSSTSLTSAVLAPVWASSLSVTTPALCLASVRTCTKTNCSRCVISSYKRCVVWVLMYVWYVMYVNVCHSILFSPLIFAHHSLCFDSPHTSSSP